uniref:Uncharacterized protein n=1 Tax=Caenorhabditis japonica TaxID=281687 RepID=A0A8R1E0J8_CAEJA
MSGSSLRFFANSVVRVTVLRTMLKLKWLLLFVILLVYVYAEDKYCPGKENNKGTNCGSSFMLTYDCCGFKDGDCCYTAKKWVFAAWGILFIVSIVTCILGCICGIH